MTDKIRLGIVGAGAITQVGHLPALRKVREIDVVGICDNDLAKARALADRFEIPVVHSDITELLEFAPLDAVLCARPIICTNRTPSPPWRPNCTYSWSGRGPSRRPGCNA